MKTNTPEITRNELISACTMLAGSERGVRVLCALLALINSGGDGLDSLNQRATLTILRAQFGPFAGSTRDEIHAKIGYDLPDKSADMLARLQSINLLTLNQSVTDPRALREILRDIGGMARDAISKAEGNT